MEPENTEELVVVKEERKFTFKDCAFTYYKNISGKKKIWKSLKQVITYEKSLPWKEDDIYYSAISAPPSFKPAKKYSDISGLMANYTDPQTKLYFATYDEFSTIRSLPSDIINGYLTLRGEQNPIG